MEKTTLYQLDTAGNVKIWMIEVIKNEFYSEIVVTSGRKDSPNLVKNVSKVMEGKNFGKVNETDDYEQAVSEAESTIKSQLKKGYVYDLKDVKSSGVLGSGIPSPMLAQKYHPTGEQKGSKTLEQMKIKGKKIVIQTKLDGNRAIIKKLPYETPVMYSRSGDVMPVQLPHIIADVQKHCLDDSEFILDGELYSDKFSFNKLNGLIKRVTLVQQDEQERKHIKYHLYDAMLDGGYESRRSFIESFSSENIEIVPSYEIVATDENIKEYLEQFLKDGFEGLMIRVLGIPYEHKRSWQLVKCKIFDDSEYKLIGFNEDVRGNFVGSFVLETKDGVRFSAGASGQSVDDRTEMWLNQEKYLGKMATVCYFGVSEYGIPRFGKLKAIRE